MKYECIKSYASPLNIEEDIMQPVIINVDNADRTLHYEVLRRQADFPNESYRTALAVVSKLRPELVQAYMAQVHGRTAARSYAANAAPGATDPAAQIDRLARHIMDHEPRTSYSEACRRILTEYPSLGARWSAFTSMGAEV